MLRWAALVVLATFVLAAPRPVHACVCFPQSPVEAATSARAVIEVEIVRERNRDESGQRFGAGANSALFEARVVRTWKGPYRDGRKLQLEVRTHTSCSPRLEVGVRYLLHLGRPGEDGHHHLITCQVHQARYDADHMHVLGVADGNWQPPSKEEALPGDEGAPLDAGWDYGGQTGPPDYAPPEPPPDWTPPPEPETVEPVEPVQPLEPDEPAAPRPPTTPPPVTSACALGDPTHSPATLLVLVVIALAGRGASRRSSAAAHP